MYQHKKDSSDFIESTTANLDLNYNKFNAATVMDHKQEEE